MEIQSSSLWKQCGSKATVSSSVVGRQVHLRSGCRQHIQFTVGTTKRRRDFLKQVVIAKAVSKSDLDELEMQLAVVKQEMQTAADEERFQDAAQFRDRLKNLQLKQRCLQIEQKEGLRDSICYRIGQIMQHKRYKYRGVIFGVHPFCQASESWIQSMGVDSLPQGRHQPFYQVLADERDRRGGMITYVAQENIDAYESPVDTPDPIRNKQIKQMFKGYDSATKRFQPTKELLEMYPDSIEAREQADTTEQE